jgi:hypothetical protein
MIAPKLPVEGAHISNHGGQSLDSTSAGATGEILDIDPSCNEARICFVLAERPVTFDFLSPLAQHAFQWQM